MTTVGPKTYCTSLTDGVKAFGMTCKDGASKLGSKISSIARGALDFITRHFNTFVTYMKTNPMAQKVAIGTLVTAVIIAIAMKSGLCSGTEKADAPAKS